MDRHSGGGPPPHLRGRPVSGLEAAHANEYFEPFLNATTLKSILGYHRSMCEFLHLKPNVFPHFYPKLRANLTSWRAKALWKKFDARASHKCYGKGKACAGTKVLVIGGGPCGLRTAIEAQLLGAKVVVVEKRDRLSRNNVLHLWPFVIEDLRMLGAKKFFGKFCAGSIDHISIRQIQCILLKVALLLGVEVHTEISFENLIEPSATEKTGWRAAVKPENHPVSQYEFDVIIGADGKRNTLQGFKRKEFRGKLAIAITANFINKKTEAEARVEEISGVAFIFNQKFFKDLQEETRIDLENIVYYKDDTHYFVMTAKKASLLEKGVIKQDLADTEKLLAPDNVNRDALQNYAREAADFSTNYQLPNLEFAVNHYGQPDVAMFDFTSMYAAEYASKVVERNGSRLLMILVGDSLLEPFWPTGSGCARGFLSSLDAAWAIRSWSAGQMTPLDVLAERESIYRLLAQTTPDNLNKDWKSYTLDPSTRYPNLNKTVVTPHQTVCLYDTDNPDSIDKMKRASLEASIRQEHVPKKRRRGIVDKEALLNWLKEQLHSHEDITVTDIASVFRDGKPLCAIIHHYRPDLLDYGAIKSNEPSKCNQLAMDILEKELGVPPFMTGEEITNTEDYLAMATYLTQVYDTFRGEIPHIKHPKLRKNSPSKIPRSVLKKLPKTLECPLNTKLFEKLNMIEQKFSQTTVITPSTSNIKSINKKKRHETGCGDNTSCQKFKIILNEHEESKNQNNDNKGKKQKMISRDDLEIVKRKKSEIKNSVKKRNPKYHSIETGPLKTLSEKTFLTSSIESLKGIKKRINTNNSNKIEYFDLTYVEEDGSHIKKKIKLPKPTLENKVPEKIRCKGSIKKIGKKSSQDISEDTRLKKIKSKNLLSKSSECKVLKIKKIKQKKSKLSVIPENREDTISEKTKILSHTKNSASKTLQENSSERHNINNKVTNEVKNIDSLEIPKSNVKKLIQLAESNCECIDKKHNVGLKNVNTSLKIFRCETFVQNSFDDFELPKIPSKEASVKRSQEALINTQAKNMQNDVKTCLEKKPSKTTTVENYKHKPRNVKNVLGLKYFSPLQIIRKHLLMKRTQLMSVLSKSNDISPYIPEKLSNLKNTRENPAKKIKSTNIKNTNKKVVSHTTNDTEESHTTSTQSIKIQVIQKSSNDIITCQGIEYKSSLNLIKITSRTCLSKHHGKTSRNVQFDGNFTQLKVLESNSHERNDKTSVKFPNTNRYGKSSCQNRRNPADVYKFKDINKSSICTKYGSDISKNGQRVQEIFENKDNFLKNNLSSQLGSARSPCTPRLEIRRFPDYRNLTMRKWTAGASMKEKPEPTPVDAQIINLLGTSVRETSNFRKTCQKKSRRNKDSKRQKFSLENNLGNNILQKDKLIYGSNKNSLKQEAKLSKEEIKIKNNFKGGQQGLNEMDFYDEDETLPPQIYTRVQKWISQHDFKADEVKKDPEGETLFTFDVTSDITSVTRAHAKKKGEYDDVKVEQRTDVIKCESPISSSQEDFIELVKQLKDGNGANSKDNKSAVKPVTKYSQYNMKSVSAPPANFSVIVEGEESELPESNKRSEFSFKSIKTSNYQPSIPNVQQSRPSSRHKRHAEVMVPKPCSIDRKQRKRRTLERIGPSVEERQKVLEEIAANRQDRQSKRKQQRQLQTKQFIKSMQMLQANAKPDRSEPFEDYSIFLYRQTAPKFQDRVKDLEKQFTYVPDHDNRGTGLKPLTNTNADEDIASKIRSLEDKWSNQQPADKKPKDLLRAIGKIETSDWNIKQIEKKILENKVGKPSSQNADKERVPRWSREEFRFRQTKMEKKHLDRQDSSEAKYADIDKNIKQLELKLKEGTKRELGQNKVASITEKLVTKVSQEKKPPIEKPVQPKPFNLPIQSGSEFCHFCGKRVYLMERLSAESRFFHHGCFKCQYCHSQLRLGSYMFDRDGQYGHRFFCMHHYGMQGELPRPTKVVRKPSQKGTREASRSPQKKHLSGVAGVDLLDRVQTPERIEFSNLSAGNISSDHEELLSQMDEDEWTDKNFGASCNELDESEDDSSSGLSDTDSDDEDAFDDALEQPVTKEGTMKWAERWKNSYRKGRHSDSDGYSSSDHSSYYENSSDDSDSDTATEGEEEIRARELRKQEVRVEPPVVQTDTGTDTEMVSEESSSESSSEIQNSATEISTDSEFAQDEPTPTREVPSIALNDFHVTKTRGSGKANYPKKIQVTSGYIRKSPHEKPQSKPDIELKLSPLVPSTPNFKKPAPVLLPRTEGYALNRTQSTGGIAAKVSLELKKRYLLGESGTNGIQKSGSASTLDTKFKSFQTTISDCQKLLKPAPEVSASMQMFCSKLDERHSPILSPQNSFVFSGVNKSNEEKDKPLPPPDITITTIKETKNEKSQDNESEIRPRSPVHEATIPVPSIDWPKQNQSHSSDSLSMTSSASEDEAPNSPNFVFENIPRVEVHAAKDSDKEDILLDSLCPAVEKDNKKVDDVLEKKSSSLNQEQTKSITSEKKSLNQPKSLPNLESVLPDIHKALHVKIRNDKEESPEENKSIKTVSGKSSPDVTAALTETELSDWARDENVSDSIELDMSHGSDKKKNIKIAKLSEFDEALNHHVCGKDSKEVANKIILTETVNNALSGNLDNIEYMDTGTETSSDDGIVDSQNGYVLFKNDDDLAEDSLNPVINEIFEAKNIYLTKKEDVESGSLIKNTDYSKEDNQKNNFGGEIIDLSSADLERLKQKQTLADHEEDSLLIIETGTTTEENTCSDSTVKNITEITADKKDNKDKPSFKIENLQKQRLEDKLAKVKAEQALFNEQKLKEVNEKENIESNLRYEEHCQRLQSKVEFGNARDSIDIRKSRRKSKTESPQKPDLIQEEKDRASPPKDITLNLKPFTDVLYKKEHIKKERDVNKKLIEEMVMNKMKAENKSLERKKRNRSNVNSLSPCRPYEIQKSSTSDLVSKINLDNLDKTAKNTTPNSTSSSAFATPDLLSDSIPLRNIQSDNNVPDINSSTEKYSTPPMFTPKQSSCRPLSVYSTFTDIRKLPETPLTNPENFSLPDIRKKLFSEDFKTPKAPPRYNRPSDVARTAEKMKENARARARLLSNEDLGLSPEDKLNKLREKVGRKGKENEAFDVHVQESIQSLVLNTEQRNSQLYSNDTLTKKKNNSFRRSKSGDSEKNVKLSERNSGISVAVRPKSISEIPKNLSVSKSSEIKIDGNKKICKSDPNLLDTNYAKSKKKSKDRERRKSITKLIVGIFTKKSPTSNGSKGLFAKLSPKSKAVSKSLTSLDLCKQETVQEEPIKKRSTSSVNIRQREPTPPPIPPLPVNYTMKATDESSDGELLESKHQDRGSCDTLDQSGKFEASISSITGKRSGKARRVSRQAQLKRHRMAQEIQRKLEETEVKTRELEQRGVEVEKTLRGENNEESLKDESELLQEWFDLMRDRSELRRYEKELMVRAQELELEDRHSRLQTELRERLESNENKTEEDLKIEETIINEMMEIVAKRDALISILEEDRLRYSNEDKDLEEQMLAKGLMLTPIQKSPEN